MATGLVDRVTQPAHAGRPVAAANRHGPIGRVKCWQSVALAWITPSRSMTDWDMSSETRF